MTKNVIKNNEKQTDFGARPIKKAQTYVAARHIPKDKASEKKSTNR